MATGFQGLFQNAFRTEVPASVGARLGKKRMLGGLAFDVEDIVGPEAGAASETVLGDRDATFPWLRKLGAGRTTGNRPKPIPVGIGSKEMAAATARQQRIRTILGG